MIKCLLLFLIIMMPVGWAKPDKIEVWFLSQHSKKVSKHVWSKNLLALNTNELSCDPVGEYCFDPQVGLYKKEKNEIKLVDLPEDHTDPAPALLKGTETDLIHCDRNLYFDVFCGKAKKEEAKRLAADAKFEIWIDVSSSLRDYDGLDRAGECHRKSFIRRLQSDCGKKMKIQTFNTSIKEMGSLDTLCDATGLNDQKRLMKWIDASEAKELIIITDINEYTKELADYLATVGGTFRGDAVDRPLIASELVNYVSDLAKQCK